MKKFGWGRGSSFKELSFGGPAEAKAHIVDPDALPKRQPWCGTPAKKVLGLYEPGKFKGLPSEWRCKKCIAKEQKGN